MMQYILNNPLQLGLITGEVGGQAPMVHQLHLSEPYVPLSRHTALQEPTKLSGIIC